MYTAGRKIRIFFFYNTVWKFSCIFNNRKCVLRGKKRSNNYHVIRRVATLGIWKKTKNDIFYVEIYRRRRE